MISNGDEGRLLEFSVVIENVTFSMESSRAMECLLPDALRFFRRDSLEPTLTVFESPRTLPVNPLSCFNSPAVVRRIT